MTAGFTGATGPLHADVAIAGGGIAGLACGEILASAGLRVVVCEAQAHLGGRAASFQDATTGDMVDIGPHVLSSEHRNFNALLDRVGTAGHIAWQPDPLITLLDGDARLHMRAPAWPAPLHGLPNLPNAARCLSWADMASNWRIAWRALRMGEDELHGLDRLSALVYLNRLGVTPRAIEWFWSAAVLALLNVPLARCSAEAMMRVFRLMLGRSGYHFGFSKVALSQLYVPGCRRAIESAGGAVLTSAAVRTHRVYGGRFQSMVLEDGREVTASAGVFALAPDALARMAQSGHAGVGLPLHEAQRFEPVRYLSTYLWFDRPVADERFWACVGASTGLNTDFYDLSNIRYAGGMAGSVPSLIASNAIHATQAWEWSDATVIDRTLHQLARFAPSAREARLVHARVHRISMAVPAPQPDTQRLRPHVRSGVTGLYIAGDWSATGLPCSMESAARSAALAAEAVGAQLGRAVAPTLALPETTGLAAWLRRGDKAVHQPPGSGKKGPVPPATAHPPAGGAGP